MFTTYNIFQYLNKGVIQNEEIHFNFWKICLTKWQQSQNFLCTICTEHAEPCKRDSLCHRARCQHFLICYPPHIRLCSTRLQPLISLYVTTKGYLLFFFFLVQCNHLHTQQSIFKIHSVVLHHSRQQYRISQNLFFPHNFILNEEKI